MTSSKMGRRYIEEARGRQELVRLAKERVVWADGANALGTRLQ